MSKYLLNKFLLPSTATQSWLSATAETRAAQSPGGKQSEPTSS